MASVTFSVAKPGPSLIYGIRATLSWSMLESLPYHVAIDLDHTIMADTWGIHADGVNAATIQYWDDTSTAWVDANSQIGAATICTGAVAWFPLGSLLTQQKWRLLITDADPDCKIYRLKMCNTSEPVENIEITNPSVLTSNPLAKSASSATTYIKAVDVAEDIMARAMSLRSGSRTVTTVSVAGMPGLRRIYDVISTTTARWGRESFRVTGISERLDIGQTTLELFK